ncbi:hypothetical protein SDC9_148408 [bioreactor metagenome]|uniref:LPS export ABC transporter periplasmic protein LptC n=1 Tax=bioreactor metagenome TaxID=1076179 RepID=A0A645EIV4_9ZZZZ
MMLLKKELSKLFIICSLICLNAACQKTEAVKPIATDLNIEKRADQTCYNFDISFIDSSNTKAVLKSKRARIFLDSNKTFLDSGVNVFFYTENGKQTGTLAADNLIIDDITKNMFATSNVVVISDSSKTRLETNKLEWNNENQKIYSNVYVKIISPTETIEGWGLESDEKLTNYKIFKVKGIKQ